MKKILSAIAIGGGFILALVSCSLEENTMNPVPSDPRVPMTFYAGSEDDPADAGKDTKTSFHPEDGAVYWSELDTIRVFDGSSYDNAFSIDEGYGSSTGKFSGLAVPGAETYYALYPYSSEAWFFGNKISSVLPGEQTYAAGTFATKLNPSVAKTAGDENSFLFHNVASIIQVTNEVSGKTVKEITVNAPSIAGGFIVDMSGDTFAAEPVADTTSLSAVTLSAAGDDALGAGPYYIVVLPGTYATLDVVVTFTDGTIAVKSYTNLEVPVSGGRSVTVKDEDIQVSEEKNLYEKFMDGENLTIAGKTYNRSQYNDTCIVRFTNANSTIYQGSSKFMDGKIYFIDIKDQTDPVKIGDVGDVVIVGVNPQEKSHVIRNSSKLNLSAIEGSREARLVMANVIMDDSGTVSPPFTVNSAFKELTLDNCDLFTKDANDFIRSTSANCGIAELNIVNCDISVYSRNQVYLFNASTVEQTMNVNFRNNIVHCDNALATTFRLIHSANSASTALTIGNIDICSNTFANVAFDNSAMVIAQTIEEANIEKNLLYFNQKIDTLGQYWSVLRTFKASADGSVDDDGKPILNVEGYPKTSNCVDNIAYYLPEDITTTTPIKYFRAFQNNNFKPDTGTIDNFKITETDIFAGGDLTTFTPAPEYASYGAQR